MKIDITYCSPMGYNKKNITQWAWTFKRYKLVKGFIIRIFGVYINIRENKAFEKIMGIVTEKRMQGLSS